jgi:hypothetical protein
VAAEHQPIPDDDPYLEEIQVMLEFYHAVILLPNELTYPLAWCQNRIEGMFERAQATAALQWVPESGNNQFETDPGHSRSDRNLKRAATVVYSLRVWFHSLCWEEVEV